MSLQQTIAKLVMKLPGPILVQMAGGKPVTIRGRTLEPQLQMMMWNGRNAPPFSSLPADIVQAAVIDTLAQVAAPLEPGAWWVCAARRSAGASSAWHCRQASSPPMPAAS